MRTETAGRVLFLSLLALTLYLMYLIFKPFLTGLIWATVLAVAFQPVYRKLLVVLRGRSWAAAILLSAVVAAVVVVPASVAVVKVAQGAAQIYGHLSEMAAAGQSPADTLRSVPAVSAALEWVESRAGLTGVDLSAMLLEHLQSLGGFLTSQAKALVANAIRSLITLAVLLVTLAVLFHEGPRVVETVRQILPLGEKDKEEVFKELQAVTRAVFYGVLLTALIQAVAGTVGFAIAGVGAAVTLGGVMFICALLPGGTALVWAPVALWLLATGSTGKGIFLLIWGVAVVSMIDNFVRPIFIGRGVRMHMLLVFFGVLGGLMAFGLIGLFAGPMIITLFLFLVEVVRRDFFLQRAPAA